MSSPEQRAAKQAGGRGTKLAVMSEFLPPSTSSPGQSGMIYRLLEPLDPAAYCLISRVDFNSERYHAAPNRLPAAYYCLSGDPVPPSSGAPAGLRGALGLPRRLGGLWARSREIAAILRREGCSAIIACPDRVSDLPVAYVASRLAGVDYLPYYFDYYSAWFNSGSSGLVTRRLEPFLLRHATKIIVPNESLADTLERRYDVEATVIRNACDLSLYDGSAPEAAGVGTGELRVVFTGAIYDAHYEGFHALLGAFERQSAGSRLHVYTPTPASVLADHGLDGRVVFHGYTPPSAIPDVQKMADVLFLPLGFHSPFPEVLRTSAPAKLAEYLAAARPILVRAPADSFVAQYFRRYDCGLVVTEQGPAALANAFERLARDPSLRERLCANARERAREDFDLRKARAAFAELVGLDR